MTPDGHMTWGSVSLNNQRADVVDTGAGKHPLASSMEASWAGCEVTACKAGSAQDLFAVLCPGCEELGAQGPTPHYPLLYSSLHPRAWEQWLGSVISQVSVVSYSLLAICGLFLL